MSTSIGDNEEIKYIGTYDVKLTKLQLIPGYPGGNIAVIPKITGICGDTFISVNFTNSQSPFVGGPNYVDETFSMVTYPNSVDNIKLGSLVWSGTYRGKIVDGQTLPSIQQFSVIGSSGIYSGINRVIYDFTNPTRVIYFIGPKIV